jgi:hypothetical protein
VSSGTPAYTGKQNRKIIKIVNPASCLFMVYLSNLDGFVKSPDAALRFILRHYGVQKSTPQSSGLVRLACVAFYGAVEFGLFFDFLRSHQP